MRQHEVWRFKTLLWAAFLPLRWQWQLVFRNRVCAPRSWRRWRKSTAARAGLDLQDCEPGTTTRLLFEAGEARGAESANASCALAAQMTGLVLYMEPEQLAVWSPSVIPLVTALANPGSAWPSHIAAYRSPDRSLDLAAGGSVAARADPRRPAAHSPKADAAAAQYAGAQPRCPPRPWSAKATHSGPLTVPTHAGREQPDPKRTRK